MPGLLQLAAAVVLISALTHVTTATESRAPLPHAAINPTRPRSVALEDSNSAAPFPKGLPTNTPTPPTGCPSGEPSFTPSGEPTYFPTGVPTNTPTSPTGCPSGEPTYFPTGVPTNTPTSPTGCPSGEPSFTPSVEPTYFPTGVPTNTPTSPTSCPSGEPSFTPSGEPTYFPTGVPTNTPTSPTGCPSSEPTYFPTGVPTNTPTSPTGCPSVEPSFTPSGVPTYAPAIVSSGHPTGEPTYAPVFAPSSQPSSESTRLPTFPSSGMPSRSPLSSSNASVLPSGEPTKSPVLAHISFSPIIAPFPSPTSSLLPPSSSNSSFCPDTSLASRYNHSIYEFSPNFPIFESFFCGSFTKPGDLSLFITETALPLDNYYYSNLRAYFYSEFSGVQAINCSDSSFVQEYRSSLVMSLDFNKTCGGFNWQVYSCGGVLTSCVDCDFSCDICPGSDKYITGNPSPSCANISYSFTLISFTIKQEVLYPVFIPFSSGLLLNYTAGPTNIDLSLNVSSPGVAYCAAFEHDVVPLSVVEVVNANFYIFALNSGVFHLTISSLYPETLYDVYCYTQDFGSNGMDYSAMLSTKTEVTTSCCREILLLTTANYIVEFNANDNRPETVFTFEALGKPSVSTIFEVSLFSDNQSAINETFPQAYPATFTFGNSSSTLEGMFVVRGSPGTFTLKIATLNSILSYRPWYSNLTILDLTAPIPPPRLLSAIFIFDGSAIVISFDSSTDLGASAISNPQEPFMCDEIIAFKVAAQDPSNSVCTWSSPSSLQVALNYVTTSQVLAGDTVQLLNNVVRAYCYSGPSCGNYPYAFNESVTVQLPSSVISPRISLMAASQISPCDNATIDPTGSYGNGGRPWSQVVWGVLENQKSSSQSQLISSYLNTNFIGTSAVAAIPSQLLSRGSSYTISLRLTNFLGAKSASSVIIQVTTDPLTPNVAVVGPQYRVVFRPQPISIQAQVSPSVCAATNSSTFSFTYSWTVFYGITPVMNITSLSLNPRTLTIPAFTLTAGLTYVVKLTATYIGGSTGASSASTTVTLNVGYSGVTAGIAGGSTRTIGNASPLTLDASQSINNDNPTCTSCLQYTWQCTELSPIYGASCPFTLPQVAAFSLIMSQVTAVSQFNFTVTARSSNGQSSSASSVVTVLIGEVPEVLMSAVKALYNYNEKITLSGIVTANSSGLAAWASSDVAISDASLVPVSLAFPAGITTLRLAIRPGYLFPAVSYMFSLRATYQSSNSSLEAVASVLVVMNKPPTGGSIRASPLNGTTLVTTFTITTYGWNDAPDNYPLTYSIQCVIGSSTLLLSQGLQPFVSTFLSQGLASNNYGVRLQAAAIDAYQGVSGLVLTSVNVFPMGFSAASTGRRLLSSSTDLSILSEISTIYSSLITEAFQISDPQKALQAISATATALNSVNCSTPVNCFLLNRSPCSSTPNTCGPCFSTSLIGSPGDANTPCSSAKLLRSVGVNCTSNDICASASCISGICQRALKSCPSNCSFNGKCIFYDHNLNIISACYFDDPSCIAVCSCADGYAGQYCSVPSDQLNLTRSLRDDMCGSLYASTKIQDVSYNVVLMRAALVSSLLNDITLLSSEGITNCTLTLTQMIYGETTLTQDSNAFTGLAGALSSVIGLGRDMGDGLMVTLFDAIYQLAINHQSYLTPGETGTSLITSTIRYLVTVQLGSSSGPVPVAVPQSQQEVYLGQLASSYEVPVSSPTASVAVAIIQTTVNFVGNNTGPIIRVLLNTDLTSSNFTKRTAHVVMQNPYPIDYNIYPPEDGTAVCQHSYFPYNLTVNCLHSSPLVFECPAGSSLVTHNYTCPSRYNLPECVMWDGVAFAESPFCTVVAYSSHNVTCSCRSPNSSATNTRRLSTSPGGYTVQEFSTTVRVISSDFHHTFSEETFALAGVTVNYVTTLTISIITGIAVLFLAVFLVNETRSRSRLAPVFATAPCDIYTFFDALLPDIFKLKPWYVRLWTKMTREHDWMVLLSPHSDSRDARSVRWVIAMGRLIAFLFIDTLLSSMFYNDDGTCQTYTTQSSCESTLKLDQLNHLCRWNAQQWTCSFNDTPLSFYALIIQCTVIIAIATPLSGLFRYMVVCLKDYTLSSGAVLKINDRAIDELDCDAELRSYETTKSKIFLTSRLTKMLACMDEVTPDSEAERLLSDKRTPWYSREDADNVKYALFGYKAGDPMVAARFVHGGRKDVIVTGIVEARQRADDIKNILESLESSQERQIYLIQSFLVESLPGYRRDIVHSFFFEEFDRVHRKKSPAFILLCAVGVVAYLLALPIYVFLYGITIGSLASNTWLAIFLFVFFEDVFLLCPVKIWFKYIVISSAGSRLIQSYHDLLKRRAEVVLRRYVGLMSHANALIHHFNPACRAARTFPDLPVSRLLISLNDFDLPAIYDESTQISSKLDQAIGVASTALGIFSFVVTFLPDPFSAALIDILILLGVNVILAVFALMAEVSISLPIIVGITAVGIIIAREVYKSRKAKAAVVSDDEMAVGTLSGKKARYAADLDDPVDTVAKVKPSGGSLVDELESPVISEVIIKPGSDNFEDMAVDDVVVSKPTLSQRPSRKNVVAAMNDVLDSVERSLSQDSAEAHQGAHHDSSAGAFHDIGSIDDLSPDKLPKPLYSISSVYIPLRKRKYLAVEEDEHQEENSQLKLQSNVKISKVSVPTRKRVAVSLKIDETDK